MHTYVAQPYIHTYMYTYFKGRNSRDDKVSWFSQILGKFAKVWHAENIFVKTRKRLSHSEWISKDNLIKIEKDLLEYA